MAKDLLAASYVPGADVSLVRRRLASFAGKLRVHAAMETDALYPALLDSGDQSIRERSQRLYDEIGHLYDEFDTFMERWGTEEKIAAHLIRFRVDLARMLATLGRRMVQENRQLYPMADSL